MGTGRKTEAVVGKGIKRQKIRGETTPKQYADEVGRAVMPIEDDRQGILQRDARQRCPDCHKLTPIAAKNAMREQGVMDVGGERTGGSVLQTIEGSAQHGSAGDAHQARPRSS